MELCSRWPPQAPKQSLLKAAQGLCGQPNSDHLGDTFLGGQEGNSRNCYFPCLPGGLKRAAGVAWAGVGQLRLLVRLWNVEPGRRPRSSTGLEILLATLTTRSLTAFDGNTRQLNKPFSVRTNQLKRIQHIAGKTT